MFKKKILVVDDSKFVSKIIYDILIAENYDVVTASSGEEGLKKVGKKKRSCSPRWSIAKIKWV